MLRPSKYLFSLVFLPLLGCDDADPPAGDAGRVVDAALADASTDAAPDAGPSDAASADAASDTGLNDAAPIDAAPPLDAGGAGFGIECAGDPDCAAPLVCRSVGMLGLVCTSECTEDSDCPPGSMGPKCNMMGLCRP
jgi:hypothetical protein